MNVKAETKCVYHERINRVLNFINQHLNEHLDVMQLAHLGNYSPYHFHRIMRAHLGESLGAHIVRLRMEAASNLLLYSGEAINDIAFNVGYENPSSFNKAFKKRFGVSPAEYRKNNVSYYQSLSSTIKFNAMENLKSLQPKFKEVKPKTVIYTRTLGNYNHSAGKAWNTVCEFAGKKKLFGFGTEFIGISHDDPKVTDAEKLRYDACIVVKKEVLPEGEIGIQEISGGKYAVFTHKGPYEKLENSYDYIFGKWLYESESELRNVPCFEKYLNEPEKIKPEKLLTEIYVPVQ